MTKTMGSVYKASQISRLTLQKKKRALHEGKCGTKDLIIIYLTTGDPLVTLLGGNLSSLLIR